MDDEAWRGVPGLGGHYEASSLGRVRVKDRVVRRRHPSGSLVDYFYKGRVLKPCRADKLGHMVVHLGVDGERFNASVHRLVLEAFVGHCPDGMEGCHNDGDASNNRVGNLRWDTHAANNSDRLKHGTYATGERHKMARLTNAQVREMRDSGLGYEDAAVAFGISRTHAHGILRGDRRVAG